MGGRTKLKHILVGTLATWILWSYTEILQCDDRYDPNFVVCVDNNMHPIDQTPWEYVDGYDTKQECKTNLLQKRSETIENQRKEDLYITNKFGCWPAGYMPTQEDSEL